MVSMHGRKAEEATHEPYPLIPSFSPSAGEGARRAVEGESYWFMVPVHGIKAEGLSMNRGSVEVADES
jgi:hypothetical protein